MLCQQGIDKKNYQIDKNNLVEALDRVLSDRLERGHQQRAAAQPRKQIMQIHTKEHEDLIKMFEREVKGYRLDKEPKDLWSKGRIYTHGELNELFLMYRRGYAFGVAVSR